MKTCPTHLPLAAALLGALALAAGCGRGMPETVPVLMYHQLAADPGADVWTVSTAEFRRQVADLKAHGYQTILPEDLARYRPWTFWLPRKPVVITFDDGLLSTLTEAEPVLQAAGFRAVSYLILNFIADTPAERRQYRGCDCLTWEEIRAMQARGTFAFGIHSFSHTPDPAAQAQEVAECRRIFKRQTDTKCRDYCYPHGGAPDLLVQAVSNAGYRTAMVCEDQMFRLQPDADFLRIPRVSVYGGTHRFVSGPLSGTPAGGICAEVKNDGLPLPVRGVLRDPRSGRAWPFQPPARLGPEAQPWCWTNLPAGLPVASLQLEIQEQNGLFGYAP